MYKNNTNPYIHVNVIPSFLTTCIHSCLWNQKQEWYLHIADKLGVLVPSNSSILKFTGFETINIDNISMTFVSAFVIHDLWKIVEWWTDGWTRSVPWVEYNPTYHSIFWNTLPFWSCFSFSFRLVASFTVFFLDGL